VAAADVGRRTAGQAAGWLVAPSRGGQGGLAYGLGQRHQIVRAGRRLFELANVADQIPTPRGGEPAGMTLTQVVRVRFGVRGEWADDGGRVSIDIRQCCDGRFRATVTGTAAG
jgi:hypothetical protein